MSAFQSTIPIIFALGGTALLIWATIRALRPRSPGESFAWIILAGIAHSVLTLAISIRSPESDGLRTSALQLLAVLLAAALGGLASSREEAESASGGLSRSAFIFAWLSLLGLPPTIGFHSKLLIFRALLGAQWHLLAIVALATSALTLAPALLALSSYRPSRLRGLRAFVVIILLLAIIVLGLYPQWGLTAVETVVRVVGGR